MVKPGRPKMRPSPRERIVRAAGELIRAKGVSATGLREVVAAADAPWGSLQHYFPGGKDQIVSEALLWMGGVAARRVELVLASLAEPTPSALFAGTVQVWRDEFLRTDFAGGCPLVAAAADVAGTSEPIRAVIAEAFEAWQQPLAAGLTRTGVPSERATSLASLLISALEGAIVLSRVRRDTLPLDTVVAELSPMLDAAVAPNESIQVGDHDRR